MSNKEARSEEEPEATARYGRGFLVGLASVVAATAGRLVRESLRRTSPGKTRSVREMAAAPGQKSAAGNKVLPALGYSAQSLPLLSSEARRIIDRIDGVVPLVAPVEAATVKSDQPVPSLKLSDRGKPALNVSDIGIRGILSLSS
jgi:uncharacterized protein YbjT (DUF2867 family)